MQGPELGRRRVDRREDGVVVPYVGLERQGAGGGRRGVAVEYGDAAPRASSRAATAAPMPEAPPVTRAPRPAKSPVSGAAVMS